MRVAEYLASLRERFAGKDPRNLVGKPRGRIVLVFKEATGTERVTIELDKSVTVTPGLVGDDTSPTAYIFGKLADWVQLFERFDESRMSALSFYGDLALVARLPELAHQQTSPLSIRFQR